MKKQPLLHVGTQSVFVLLWLLVAGLVLYAAHRFRYESDWTATARNSLTRPSVGIVKGLKGPVTIDAFAHGPALRHNVRTLIDKYRRVDRAIHLVFINPDKHPGLVRRIGVTFNGELWIHYQKRAALVLSPTETGVTNQLARLERSGVHDITFLTGDEERKANSPAVLGLSSWVQQLRARGFRVSSFNPGTNVGLPPHPGILVIADPRVRFLPGELALLRTFVNRGGNLFLMFEPHHTEGLRPLVRSLGVNVGHGFVVDPASSLLTGADPSAIAIDHYPDTGPVRGMHLVTVFPTAVAVTPSPVAGIRARPILLTDNEAWMQKRPLGGLVTPPPGVHPGALTLGVALDRLVHGKTQRIVILGDSDFASNSYLGEGGNLALAMNIANWLADDDSFINLPNRASSDLTLSLTGAEEDVIAFGFLIILPLLFLGSGLATWWRRRRL